MRPPAHRSHPARPLVLVADADPQARRRLARFLSGQGHETVLTSRGEQVLRLTRCGPVGAVVVDTRLADMGGHALATLLRERHPRLAIIMTSADHRSEVELRAREIGVVLYAHKPLDLRRVAAVVERAAAICEADLGQTAS